MALLLWWSPVSASQAQGSGLCLPVCEPASVDDFTLHVTFLPGVHSRTRRGHSVQRPPSESLWGSGGHSHPPRHVPCPQEYLRASGSGHSIFPGVSSFSLNDAEMRL